MLLKSIGLTKFFMSIKYICEHLEWKTNSIQSQGHKVSL